MQTLAALCLQAGLDEEPRRLLGELAQIHSLGIILFTDHQAILHDQRCLQTYGERLDFHNTPARNDAIERASICFLSGLFVRADSNHLQFFPVFQILLQDSP